MSTARRIFGYEVRNVARGRAVLVFGACLLLLTEGLIRIGGGGDRAVVSLLTVVLYLVPLISIVFGTMYLYAAREFIEVLLAQPVERRALFTGMFAGLLLPLAASILTGLGLPFLWHGGGGAIAILLLTGLLLAAIFLALAFLIALVFEDRAKGLGAAIVLWLVLAVLYDGAVLAFITGFREYPIETPLLLMTLANPIDVGRLTLLLSLDIAALLGYTGAAFQDFFGHAWGMAIAVAALLAWTVVPLLLGLRRFRRKDF